MLAGGAARGALGRVSLLSGAASTCPVEEDQTARATQPSALKDQQIPPPSLFQHIFGGRLPPWLRKKIK